MDTTRRFPRTTAEAFPCERYAAIERPAPQGLGVFGALLVAVLMVLLALGLVHVLASVWEAMP